MPSTTGLLIVVTARQHPGQQPRQQHPGSDKFNFAAGKMPYRSPIKKRACAKRYYVLNSEEIKARGRSLYWSDPDKIKVVARTSYHADPKKKKAAVRASYGADPDKKKAVVRALLLCRP